MVIKMFDYGNIYIKLDNLIKEKNISKNKLANRAEMQRTQLNNYCKNNMQRIDISIIARLCYVLDCEISDLFEYIPPSNKIKKD